jgi:hypothetical protein
MFRHAAIPGILLSALTVAADAQPQCTPIRFALGASTATLRGTARSDPPFACYTLATGPRKTATIRILQGAKSDMAFNIEVSSKTGAATPSKQKPKRTKSMFTAHLRAGLTGRSRCRFR